MRTMMFFLVAASLPSIWGQNKQPPPPNAGAQAQSEKLEDDPAFKRLSPEQQDWVRTMTGRLNAAVERKDIDTIEQMKLDVTKRQIMGMTLCDHRVDDGTFVDAVFLNASRQEAIAIRWLDSKGTTIHSAVFTGDARCVAKGGDTLEGKSITRVMPNSLAVSNQHALTAWEGEYWNSPIEQAAGGAPHRGVFIENRFLVELDPRKASTPGSRDADDKDRDFRWSDEREVVAVKPGIALVPVASAAAATTQSQPAPAATPDCTPKQGSNVKARITKKPSEWACKTLGICVDDKAGESSAGNGCPAAPANGQPAK